MGRQRCRDRNGKQRTRGRVGRLRRGAGDTVVSPSPGLTCRKDRLSEALKGSSGCSSHPCFGRATLPGSRLRPRPELS